MALGNPHETYDADVASQFLKGVGEKPVRAATTELLNRGVLAKLIRDPTKVKPGRTLKISDRYAARAFPRSPKPYMPDPVIKVLWVVHCRASCSRTRPP